MYVGLNPYLLMIEWDKTGLPFYVSRSTYVAEKKKKRKEEREGKGWREKCRWSEGEVKRRQKVMFSRETGAILIIPGSLGDLVVHEV